jgi:hypothetical protein
MICECYGCESNYCSRLPHRLRISVLLARMFKVVALGVRASYYARMPKPRSTRFTSKVYTSKIPYQWEAGSYNAISHSMALEGLKPEPICSYCHHPLSSHDYGKRKGDFAIRCKKASCTCAEFQMSDENESKPQKSKPQFGGPCTIEALKRWNPAKTKRRR